ncbi:MAG: GLUG motif-containing protein, partial [Bacteroidales bacterium]|nr:GLUG motif-containing protein [Bacteroidales bacterium]
MKTTQFRWLVTMLLLVTAMAMPKMAWAEITPTQPRSGDGTSANPYQIGTKAELYWFAALVNGTLTDGTSKNPSACAVLVKDITVNENLLSSKLDENDEPKDNVNIESWTPIGYYISSSDYVYYEGIFDGNGYSISGLYVKYTNQSRASFIGGIKDGCVKNIAILDSYFEGSELIGGIVGYTINGFIKNCLFSGTVKGPNIVGGICGAAYGDRTISDCFSNAQILVNDANNYYGGICGQGLGSSVKLRNCVYNNSLYSGQAIKWCLEYGFSAGTVEHVTGMTTEEIASGNATYWLNRYHSGDGLGWYQNIDNGQKDAYPVLDNTHGVVYTSQPCPSSGKFSNNKSSLTEVQHSWDENNVCTQCGKTKDVFDLVRGFEEPSQVGGVYQISTAGELYWFTALVNGNGLLTDGTPPNNSANAVLTKDITVNKNVLDESGNLGEISDTHLDWVPIGNSDRPYTGTFNGQGHTISGLYFNDSSKNYVGLFGWLQNGNIQNTGIVDSYFKGHYRVGGLCGYDVNGSISYCYNTGAVSGGSNSYNVGGVCGYADNGSISYCYNTGAVSGSYNVGGVCGLNYGTISNCYFDNNKYDKDAVGDNSGTVINTSGKTTEEFASGEVAYLLNNSKSDGAWGQTIGTDPYPVLDGDKVYYGYTDCDESKDQTYSNTKLADTRPKHNYVNGFCTKCGAYQPATLTTDKYDINGDNTKDEVYEIGNAGQLYWFAALVNGTLIDGTAQNLSANAVLVNDITVHTGVLTAEGTLASDVSSFTEWTLIGNNSNQYSGIFSGQGYTVSGLYFNRSTDYIGFFGHVGEGGKISNVGVVDSYFNGRLMVGGVCGRNYGSISNCYNTGAVSGLFSVGGVCGDNYGSISNCYSAGAVSGRDHVGGVCGYNNSGTISNCYFDSEKCDKDAIGTNNGTVTNVEGKTTEQFKSGEVCYLLNGSVSDGSQKWYQTIDTDGAPVLDNTRGTVYYATLLCGGEKNVGNTYANTQEVSIEHDYNENGFCTKCGAYQPATDSDSDGVYEIGNAGQLYWFAALVNGDNTHADFDAQNTSASAVLTNDIDLENREWKPITAFAGSFDGQGHTVSNFKITSTTNNSGFFGSANGTIMNFTLKGEITLSADGAEIGSIVGNTDGATIRNVVSYVNISNTAVALKHVGGVVGSIQTTETVVDQCVYYGNMNIQNSHDCIGGVVGYTSDGGRISNCANLGTVTATKDGAYVGGVLGYVNNTKAMVKNCYNYGSVSNGSTSTYCGAVIGWVRSHTAGNLADNYYLDTSCSLGFGSASNSGATATAKTAEQFASGEVCYLLNGNTSDGAWGQTIGTDPYPVLGGDKVYYGYADCDENKDQTYSNTELADTRPDHNYSNGFCTKCGAYQPATLTTDKYDIDGVEGFDEVYEIGNA